MKADQDVTSRKLIDRLVPDPRWGPMQGFFSTTYELGPDFLEMDFLPSVFGLGAWDDRSWATRIALEKHLFELDAAVILTEARRYRGRPRSLRLEVRPAVSPRGSALHAKVTLLLFENAVRLIVGSANLTEWGYRRNREAVAVLTASHESKKEAAIISQALAGADAALAPWLTAEMRSLIRGALDTLLPWTNGPADPNTAFLWTFGQTKLWREFLSRWPAGDVIKRLSIVSPFWSEDAGLTLTALLKEMKRTGSLAVGAEVRLLTDAFEGPNGQVLPILPPGYAAHDWASLGVKATAQAVSPKVSLAELGRTEGFTGTRALHAKVVLMEGSRNGLAYLGSANFTAHGWGFLNNQTAANVEAGLVLRRSLKDAAFESLIPDLVGDPVVLTNGNFQNLRAPENGPGDEPWPEFIREVLLSPAARDEKELALLIEIEPAGAPLPWSAKLPGKEGVPHETLVLVESPLEATKTSFRIPLSPQTFTRLLTEHEILICWSECPSGRPVPLNVEASARALLPISPGNQRIEETNLLSYYQGRISWEELFPDPDPPTGQLDSQPVPATSVAGVDKSRIQSYQIREFVEALTGLSQDLMSATRSEPCMRLALLGPVSPFALAQSVIEAVKSRRRTPTAAAFQLVEILACLKSACSFAVPEKLTKIWERHLEDSTKKIAHILRELVGAHGEELASNRAFRRYQKAVLDGSGR
jgi:phosphatidylserine/phosphatidylglycerophosphate/cardiolipin synthase-like enzyme